MGRAGVLPGLVLSGARMTEEERRFTWPIRGQLLFALVFVVAALLLLSQLGSETKWVKRTAFFAQPRFWPAVAVGGMALFGALHLWKLPRKRFTKPDFVEWQVWFLALEWVLWFMGYVLIVPVLGYLPTTVLFMPLMTWRMGYRRPAMLWLSVAVGLGIVVLFKTFLEVKIPGGMVYDYLPDPLRSFFILHF
ncbi:tripartite tricarboxylate transporter TctB family protein [Aquicoccus sp. G2-2]|uniref:tripartite tricarboxylate transporter TctB family protein n=1 Tax=Aquicoccus sp. G2-2 TaxID=3092120 RepID=UPI002ADF7528|nr:tripartite tricarboxylate transporter TctB family protein [Aquicoccus sp. G2-2]MEA1114042.1 tripartite tricarboxylate transporter TctB family protein [Aquicoccus sp. G2-2]